MKRLLSYLFLVLGLGLIFSGPIFAVPKILKSKVLEVCIVSEDVTIFQKWQYTNLMISLIQNIKNHLLVQLNLI